MKNQKQVVNKIGVNELRLVAASPKTGAVSAGGDGVPKELINAATVAWALAGALLVMTVLFLFATATIPFAKVVAAFPVDVIAILLTLDLFSIFVMQTGVLDSVGLKLALMTKGRMDVAAMLMGLLMFAASAFLNNLAAIFILAPIFLSLLRAMRAKASVTLIFLSLILVLCNLGGMATPMGDFPAIMLMSSGLVGFLPYLSGAFPLAASLALLAIIGYRVLIHRYSIGHEGLDDEARTRVVLETLKIRHQYVHADKVRAGLLTVIFVGMVISWARIPPSDWPFSLTAIVGTVLAGIVAGPKLTTAALKGYDLRTVIIMAAILTLAAIVSATGLLSIVATAIAGKVSNPTVLLFCLMAMVAVSAGLFSAGPATAAALPIFIEVSHGALSDYGDLVGIAFAASICAGSSMMLHSATAGPTLKGEATKAGFVDIQNQAVWRNTTYLYFGLLTSLIQLILSMVWVWSIVNLDNPLLLNTIPFILGAYVAFLISKGVTASTGAS